jgi:hypothetical protein
MKARIVAIWRFVAGAWGAASDPVKVALILSIAALIGLGIYLYASPYRECVRTLEAKWGADDARLGCYTKQVGF